MPTPTTSSLPEPPAASRERIAAERAARSARARACHPGPNLVAMLVRLPPEIAKDLNATVARTRIRKADLLRQAVADLVLRYRNHPAPPEGT